MSDQKISEKSVQEGVNRQREEGEGGGGARQGENGGGAPPFNVDLRSARMETRANSITPPDSILLGSSALVERVALAANTP